MRSKHRLLLEKRLFAGKISLIIWCTDPLTMSVSGPSHTLYNLMFLNHQRFLFASVSYITCCFVYTSIFLREWEEMSYFTFIRSMRAILQRGSSLCPCSSFGFRMGNPSVLYGMISVPTRGPIQVPHALHSSYGRTAKSRVSLIRHWDGEAHSNPYKHVFGWPRKNPHDVFVYFSTYVFRWEVRRAATVKPIHFNLYDISSNILKSIQVK